MEWPKYRLRPDWIDIVREYNFFEDLQELLEQDSEQDADASQDQDETPSSDPLLLKLSPFFDSGKSSDVTLMVGSSIFRTHKLILSLWSPVFKKMLLKTSKTDEPHVLNEAQEHEAIFSDFLKFMYTETIEISKDTVYSFHKLAKKYEVEEICDLCEEFLMGEVSDESIALQKLNDAKESGFTKVYDHCFRFLETNFFHLSDQSIKKISPSVFLKLLESSDLVVRSERHLFSQALDWVYSDSETKDAYHEFTEDVVAKIRFAHMSFSELSILKSGLPTRPKMSDRSKQRLQHLLNDAFEWKALVSCGEEEVNRLPYHTRSTLFKRHCISPRIYIPMKLKEYKNLKLSETIENCSDGIPSLPVTVVFANNTVSENSGWWSITGSAFYDEESKKCGIHYRLDPESQHIDKTYRLVVMTNSPKFNKNPIVTTSKGVVTAAEIKVEQVFHDPQIIRELTSVMIQGVIMVKMRSSDYLMGQLQPPKTDEDLRLMRATRIYQKRVLFQLLGRSWSSHQHSDRQDYNPMLDD